MSKLHLVCPEEAFEHFFFEKNNDFPNDFLTLTEKCPDFAKNLRQGYRNFNLRVRRKNLWEKNFKNWWCFGNFVLWVKRIEPWAKQFGMACQGCIRRVQRNILSIFQCKNNDFWMIFALWAKKFRTLPNIYGRVSKTSTYVSGEKICEIKIWKTDDVLVTLYFEWKKNEPWAKQLGRGCQNYIRRVQRNIVRIFHWKKDGFSYLLALWAKSLLTSAKHLRQGFRNFNLRVKRKSLREKNEKKMISQ